MCAHGHPWQELCALLAEAPGDDLALGPTAMVDLAWAEWQETVAAVLFTFVVWAAHTMASSASSSSFESSS